MSMPIAHTPSTLIPRAARVAAPGATGLEGSAVFEGGKRERILDFLLGAQRGRCARVRAWWESCIVGGPGEGGACPAPTGTCRTREFDPPETGQAESLHYKRGRLRLGQVTNSR